MRKIRTKLIINYQKRFNRHLEKAPLEIKIAFRETLELFSEDSDHPRLRNHSLKGKYAGYRSIDVTGDWRALLKIEESETQVDVTFHILGTHTKLYG